MYVKLAISSPETAILLVSTNLWVTSWKSAIPQLVLKSDWLRMKKEYSAPACSNNRNRPVMGITLWPKGTRRCLDTKQKATWTQQRGNKNIKKRNENKCNKNEHLLRLLHLSPVHPLGHVHWLGFIQRPPFKQLGTQTAWNQKTNQYWNMFEIYFSERLNIWR